MAPDRIYPHGQAPASAPPPPGTYYNVKDQPNQPIPPPATYQQRRRGRSPCRCCLIWLCAIHLILLFLIGLAVLIFWLVVHPKAPQFDVQTVHISGLTGTSPLNVTIDYRIQARNPNKKMGFYYSDINFQVQASGTNVGQGTVNDFYQGHRNITYLNGEIGPTNVTLSSATLTSISQDLSDVPFYAQVDLKVKGKAGGIKTWKIKVKVKCDINVDLTVASGSQLRSNKCKVHW